MSSPSHPTVDQSVLVVQITDSHLFAEADGQLLGMNTSSSLQHVVDLVRQEQSGIDLVLATGDISQDGSLASYQRFRELSAGLAPSERWYAGNHDERAVMREASTGSDLLDPVIDIGNWRVTLLDSSVPDAVPGYLDDSQLALLERALSEAPERHHLVCFHHHPVPIGCAWMDPIGILNPNALFAVLDRFPQVKALLWGHVHQEFDQMRNGVRLLASPSTCVQFEPGSDDFKVGNQAPGYRWLRLHPNGRLETGVSRATGIDFQIDYSVQGY